MKARKILQRLQLLSLSLESAVQSNDQDSINPILLERAELIEQLGETHLASNTLGYFSELQKIDDRVASLLILAREEIADQVRSDAGRTKSVKSYSANREATLAEQAR
jgi:hypothetical protein